MGRLPVNLKWRFIELLLLAGEQDENGFLPSIPDMSWRLRVEETTLQQDLVQLQTSGIAEVRAYEMLDNRWFLTNFQKRQAASPAAERMRQYRKRKRKEPKEKEITDTDVDTDTYRAVTPVTKRNGLVTPENVACVARETYAPGFSEDSYRVAADVLNDREATPEQVDGFGSYWKANGWHESRPLIKHVLDHWDDYLAGRNLKRNDVNKAEQRQQQDYDTVDRAIKEMNRQRGNQ